MKWGTKSRKRYEVSPGAQIGRLTVIKPADSPIAKWECKCSCGKVKVVLERSLRYGSTLSCGCLTHESVRFIKSVEGCQKKDCRYWAISGCVYFMTQGHTRTSLHIGENVDINNPCREYDPGEKVLQKVQPFWIAKDLL